MSPFVLFNWLCCLLTSLILFWVIWNKKHLLVKPSLIVIVFFHLRIQWAAAVGSSYIEGYLPDPWAFAILSQLFPLLGLFGSLLTWQYSAHAVWQRLANPKPFPFRDRRLAILLLAIFCIIFAVIYFSKIPLNRTGLYSIFTNPGKSALAREDSLKLAGSSIILYGYAFTASVFGPLLSVLLAASVINNLKRRKLIWSFLGLAGIACILILVSLSGARGYAASIVLTVLAAWFYRSGTPFKPHYILAAALAILAFPVLLTILREGSSVTWVNFWATFRNGILGRVFYVPMETGLYYVHYAQTFGFFGIQAIPRLAALLNVPAVNVPNLIALIYTQTSLQSGYANTSFVYAYYSYFGSISFIFSLIGLWMLDSALLLYLKIRDGMMLPCVAAISLACIAFVNTEYTIALLTNGFLIILIVSWLIDRLSSIHYGYSAPDLVAKSLVAVRNTLRRVGFLK